MKKLIICVMVIAMVAMFGACGDKPAERPEPVEPPVVVEEEPPIEEKEEIKEDEFYAGGIPGSNYVNITLNLQNEWKIPEGPHTSSANTELSDAYRSSSAMDPETGYTYSYNVSYRMNSEITMAFFSVTNSFLQDDATFLEYCDNYLRFCASVPYNTSDIEAAQKWVDDNINSLDANGVETTIGDAKYSMAAEIQEDGTILGVFLTILAEKEPSAVKPQ